MLKVSDATTRTALRRIGCLWLLMATAVSAEDYRPAGNPAVWQSFPIKRSGGFSTSVSVLFGHYQTSRFGAFSKFKAAKEPIRPQGRTKFSNDKLLYAFDIQSPTGRPPAHVQIGLAATGRTRGVGPFKKEIGGPRVGSITRNRSFVGRFKVVPPKTILGVPAEPRPGEEFLQTTIETTTGKISGYRVRVKRAGKSKLNRFLHGGSMVIDEYRQNGQVVAARNREPYHETMWFLKSLPHDARLCILADSALRVFEDIRDNDAGNAARTANSLQRPIR